MVKKTINALAGALIVSFMFAQTSRTATEQPTTPWAEPTPLPGNKETSTTTKEQTTTAKPATPEETKATSTHDPGVVTTYEPGKMIVVGSESANTDSCYVLDKRVRYVNRAGREIDEKVIKPGTRIHIYFAGEPGTITYVVVDED